MRALLFALVASFAFAASAQQPAQQVTAQQVIDKIEADMGTTIPVTTVDTYKAGTPDTPVTGIATTFLPTMSVLREAVAQHINLILTHEPTFYNHPDKTDFLENDPVYKEKIGYINEHHLVIFRLHDTMHAASPDRIQHALIETMHWGSYQSHDPALDRTAQYFVTLPPITVLDLARKLSATLHDHAIRVVGDPNLKITHAAVIPGAGGEAKHMKALEMPGMEVLITGEVSEWEIVEYVRDSALQGRHQALIILGHNASEEIGMQPFAQRIQQLFPAIPVKFIPAGEPYWTLDHPVPIH
jgi:putative NIF3 family GTP cyclohydrolase 1 type 2